MNNKSVLFVMLEGIGNAVLALPSLEALHAAGYTVSVCGKHPALDIVPDKFRAYTLTDLETLTTPFDAVLLSAWSTAYIEKYGRKPPIGEAMIYESDPIDGETHEAMLNFDLAACLDGVEMPESLSDIQLPEIPTDSTDLGGQVSQLDRYVAFCNTAAPGWERKRWAGYAELAHKLSDEYAIVLLGAEHDEKHYNLDEYPENTIMLSDVPLRQVTAILDNAEWVVGNDCGLTHIASALGTKTIALFGPTSRKKNKPLGSLQNIVDGKFVSQPTRILFANMACAPCQYEQWESVCQVNECMTSITPETVAKCITDDLIDLGVPTAFTSKQEQKLAVVMRVKDAMDTIEECLTAANRIADIFCIVDNGSTDGTLEYLHEFQRGNPDKFPNSNSYGIQGVADLHSKVYSLQGVGGSVGEYSLITTTKGYNQPRDRELMDIMLKKSGATWGLFLDADEIISEQITREQVEAWMHQNTYNAIKFRHVHFWNDTSHYRTDQRWKPRHNRMMWRITPESTIQDNAKLHPGIVHNLKGRVLETDYCIKHYGHLDKEKNAKRAEFYRSMDNLSMPDYSGNTYQHMTDETELKLAEWHEDTPIDKRDFGKPSVMLVLMHAKGDMLMATPTIRALASQNPDLEISVMGLGQTEERDFKTREVFENNPFVHRYYDSSIQWHPTYWEQETFHQRDLPVIEKDLNAIQQLTRFDDVIIVTLQSDYKKHRIDRFANACEVELTDKGMQVSYGHAEEERAAKTIPSVYTTEHQDDPNPMLMPVVSIHRWCGNPNKSWDYQEYKKLCERLSEHHYGLVLWDMGDPEAPVRGENIVNMRDHVNDDWTLGCSTALMDMCNLHIGADSFPMHLASAVNILTLAIFEKTLASTATPLNENAVIAASTYSLSSGDPDFYAEHAARIVPCGLNAVKADHLYPILGKMGFLDDAKMFPSAELDFMGHQIVSPAIDGFVYEDYARNDINELKACKALNHYAIPNESVFMDVGANVGRNSLLIDDSIKQGIAIEPFPEICSMLIANLVRADRMKIDNKGLFTVYQKAVVSDETMREHPKLYINASPRQSGCTTVRTHRHYLSVEAETTTIDALGHHPDLIKIDVEGVGLEVLKGAEKTLETARAIVLEIHNDAEITAIDFLRDRGFRIHYISPNVPFAMAAHHILATAKDVQRYAYPTNCLFDPAEILTATLNDTYPQKRLQNIMDTTPEFNHDGTLWFEYMGLQTLKAGEGYDRIGVYEGDGFFMMPAVMWLDDIFFTTIVDSETLTEAEKRYIATKAHKREYHFKPSKINYIKTVDEVRKQDTLICLNMLGYDADGLDRLLALIKRTNPKQLYLNFLFSETGEPTRYRGRQVYPLTRETLDTVLDALKEKAYHLTGDTDFENISIKREWNYPHSDTPITRGRMLLADTLPF